MSQQVEFKKTLGLTGVTVNAMAFIAPGAFMWLTFQMQAAQVDTSGTTTSLDIFPGVILALIMAFLTAISYSKLAELYPEAGSGSSYYFAEQAFISQNKFSAFARISKFIFGWFSHLYYWVLPGIEVAMFAILTNYIFGQFGVVLPLYLQIIIAPLIAGLAGFLAYRGINTSTVSCIVINIIQIVTVIFITILGIAYRFLNPEHVQFVHSSLLDGLLPHHITSVLFQSTIAIILFVGFESATALAAEAKSPKHVSKAVIISLIIQGVICYLLQYVSALGWMNASYNIEGNIGLAAAATSSAPIGDMIKIAGNALLNNSGSVLMFMVSLAVAITLFGGILGCINTGVRITYAMAKDDEMPSVFKLLHIKHLTPHTSIWIMIGISTVIGIFGLLSIRNLTAITFLSNIGTFVVYGMTNIIVLVAFSNSKKRKIVSTILIPILGSVVNIGMLCAVIYLGILGGGDTQIAALIAVIVTVIWLAVGIIYLNYNSKAKNRSIILGR